MSCYSPSSLSLPFASCIRRRAFGKAIVGDKTISFLLMDKEMYTGMSDLKPASLIVERGIALHKVIVFERGELVFVFNFHPEKTYKGYKVGCDLPGKYRVALDSDACLFGGRGRVGHDVDHFTSPEGILGVPETNFNNRPNSFKVLSPSHTCVAYYKVPEDTELDGGETTDAEEKSSGQPVAEHVIEQPSYLQIPVPVEMGDYDMDDMEDSPGDD